MPWLNRCKKRKKKLVASRESLERVLGIAREVRSRYSLLVEQIEEGRHGES